MVTVVRDANLFSKVVHRGLNTIGNTLDDETVDVVNVGKPSFRSFVWLDVFHSILHELLDFFAMIFNVFESRHF